MNLWIANIIGFLVANKIIVVFIALCLLIGLIGWQVDSCRTQNTEKKKEETRSNIKVQEIIANILTNQKGNIEQGIKENENNKNVAVNNFNNSIRRDSSTFNSAGAENKFCKRFCADSSCFEWRKNHECNE